MKHKIIFLILISTIGAAQADLVIQQQTTITQNKTNQSFTETIKIRGDKIRTDADGGPHADMSWILDAGTYDTFTLFHKHKSVMKESGARKKELQEKKKKQSGNTNAAESTLVKPLDTGKSEKVGAFDTEIYTYSGVNGATGTFWVAKDFPNYEKIKVDMDRLGEFAGLARLNGIITMPGMVVKAQFISKLDAGVLTTTGTLISVKEEPVDATIFEVPSDYMDETPPVRHQHTNTVTKPNK